MKKSKAKKRKPVALNRELELLWEAFFRERSETARNALIEHYVPFVALLACQLQDHLMVAGTANNSLELQDFIQIGTIGLCESIDRFDPNKHARFLTFCTPRIRGAMFDELRRQNFFKRAGRRQRRIIQRFLEDNQGVVDERKLAKTLGLPVKLARRKLQLVRCKQPIDFGNEPVGEFRRILTIKDERAEDPSCAAERQDLEEELVRVLAECTKQERTIIELYYVQEMGMEQIGQILGVTESRVCQVHKKILRHLLFVLREKRAVHG